VGVGVSRTRPILVTGAHRSGTGWVSRVIEASRSVAYLWEPFSPMHRPGICDARFSRWFTYVCGENESIYSKSLQDMLEFRYKTLEELRVVRSPTDVGRLLRDRVRFSRYRRRALRPLLKDPIAVFSAEWLHHRFGADVVVLIRHPAAFANSLRQWGFRHPFSDFLAQPLLIRDHLGGFERQLRTFAAVEQEVLDQAVLLWRMIHHAILKYRGRYPAWTFVRLEDLARDPVPSFEKLFSRLDLPFVEPVRRKVEELTNVANPVEGSDQASVRRDSRAAVDNWRSRLTEDEICRIREGVEPLSSAFYSEQEW
jgi:hypothetical protein